MLLWKRTHLALISFVFSVNIIFSCSGDDPSNDDLYECDNICSCLDYPEACGLVTECIEASCENYYSGLDRCMENYTDDVQRCDDIGDRAHWTCWRSARERWGGCYANTVTDSSCVRGCKANASSTVMMQYNGGGICSWPSGGGDCAIFHYKADINDSE